MAGASARPLPRPGPARRARRGGARKDRRHHALREGRGRSPDLLVALRGSLLGVSHAQRLRGHPARRPSRRPHRLRGDAPQLLRGRPAARGYEPARCRARHLLSLLLGLLRPDLRGPEGSRTRGSLRRGLQRLDDRVLVREFRRAVDPAVPGPALGSGARGAGGASKRGAGLPCRRLLGASQRTRPALHPRCGATLGPLLLRL